MTGQEYLQDILTSANTAVKCVSPSATISKAYTIMLLHKYSQLVVAHKDEPRQADIKGIVSFQSIAKALMNGNQPKTVGECIDENVHYAQSDDDLKSVFGKLTGSDVILVIGPGPEKRLQGIVTAWDLAEKFAELFDPFKHIGEIEVRLRTLVETLDKDKVTEFLRNPGHSEGDPARDIERLTMGDLQRVLEFQEHWDALGVPFDKVIFTNALDEVRRYRNCLMHFGDPLDEAELTHLTDFCDMVREIQL